MSMNRVQIWISVQQSFLHIISSKYIVYAAVGEIELLLNSIIILIIFADNYAHPLHILYTSVIRAMTNTFHSATWQECLLM